jgi:hypothetical protein
MKPSFGTDIISFLGVALGAVAGLALTAAVVTQRSHASHEHHEHGDMHFDVSHAISVDVGHNVKRYKAIGDEVFISELIEAELEAEQARLEGEKIRLRVGPRIEIVRSPEAVRLERREREQRRR